MANIPPVIGDQYVTPYEAQLSITRKAMQIQGGNFTITDSEGAPLFQLKEKRISLGDKKTLYDGADTPVLNLHKKKLTLHNTFEVCAGETSDKLFSLKKGSISGDVETYEVFVQGSSSADYVVKGDFTNRDYNIIYKDELVVADVGKGLFNLSSFFGGGKHKYGVKVKSGVDQAFVAAVVVIIDSIHSEEKGANKGEDESSSDSD